MYQEQRNSLILQVAMIKCRQFTTVGGNGSREAELEPTLQRQPGLLWKAFSSPGVRAQERVCQKTEFNGSKTTSKFKRKCRRIGVHPRKQDPGASWGNHETVEADPEMARASPLANSGIKQIL